MLYFLSTPSTVTCALINRGTSFLIIHTIDLREYVLSGDEGIAFITITGHPLGVIEQVHWFHNNWLMYSSGVGDMIPFGVVDIETQENYFLTGCIYSMERKKIFPNRCEDIDTRKSLVDIFIDKYEKGVLTKISHNFYESVLKMTQD